MASLRCVVYISYSRIARHFSKSHLEETQKQNVNGFNSMSIYVYIYIDIFIEIDTHGFRTCRRNATKLVGCQPEWILNTHETHEQTNPTCTNPVPHSPHSIHQPFRPRADESPTDMNMNVLG